MGILITIVVIVIILVKEPAKLLSALPLLIIYLRQFNLYLIKMLLPFVFVFVSVLHTHHRSFANPRKRLIDVALSIHIVLVSFSRCVQQVAQVVGVKMV